MPSARTSSSMSSRNSAADKRATALLAITLSMEKKGGPFGPPSWNCRARGGSATRLDQIRDREEILGGSRFLAEVEIPPLFARKPRRRQRRLGGVLQLHVHHDDRRQERMLLRIGRKLGAGE